MRPIRLALFALLLALPAASEGSLAGHPPCHGGTTVAKNRQVRVYVEKVDSEHDRLVACRMADSRRRPLMKTRYTGFRDTQIRYGDVTLNGPAVAWVRTKVNVASDDAPPDVRIGSWTAKTLKHRFRTPLQHEIVGELVVTRNAAVAWTAHGMLSSMDDGGVRVLEPEAAGAHALGVELTIISYFVGDEERYARLT